MHFNLLLGLEVLTFLLYPSIVASFSDHRPRLNIHSSPIPFKHGLSNKWCCWWPFFFYLRWNGRGILYNGLQYAGRLRSKGYVFQATGIVWGASIITKFSEISVEKYIGRFSRRWNFPVKMVHLQRWSSWTVGPVRPKLSVLLPKIFVFSPTLLSSNQHFGRNANGSFRCDWKRCFYRTMSVHFVLIIPLIMRV